MKPKVRCELFAPTGKYKVLSRVSACLPGRFASPSEEDINLLLGYIYIYIYIIVKIMATFHTDELLVSKAVGKCNVHFHIVHFVNVVGMWVSVPVPST